MVGDPVCRDGKALLFVVTVAGLGAYGATQGGSQREF